MNTEELIRNLILLPCPAPEAVSIAADRIAGRNFYIVRPDSYNITRLVGRQGATIQALKAIIAAIEPLTTISVLDPEPIKNTHDIATPIDTLTELGRRLDLAIEAQDTGNGTIAVLPDDLPETMRLAIRTVFRNATRHPKGALFLQ